MDDLLAGGTTVDDVQTKKATAIEVFQDASFTLHKWQSNAKELEASSNPQADDELINNYLCQAAIRSEPTGDKAFGTNVGQR